MRGLMSLLISGTSAAHYSLPFLSSFFLATIALSDNPKSFLFSLSESAVKD